MDAEAMSEYLGMSECEWTGCNGFYGYRFRKWCSGVSIHYGNDTVEGVLVEMSGTGCRAFETFSKGCDWVSIFSDILHDEDYIITRLDIAFDDRSGCIPLEKLVRAYRKKHIVSRFKDKSISREDHLGEVGSTLYFGSCQSEIRFRIYDKAYERGFDGVHWIRFEVQLRRDMAFQFLEQLAKSDYDVGALFSSVVANYIRFVVPPKSGSDTNKRRWRVAPYWSSLLDNALPLSLWVSKDLEYNRAACESYVYGQAGNSAWALIQLDGAEKFVENLIKKKSKKVPDKILNMIATERALAENNSNAILEVVENATA